MHLYGNLDLIKYSISQEYWITKKIKKNNIKSMLKNMYRYLLYTIEVKSTYVHNSIVWNVWIKYILLLTSYYIGY